jgi:putative ABC transport system permease protein
MRSYDVVLKNLRHRASRTALTVAGLAIAVTGIATLWNSVWGYAESSSNFYSARDVDIVVVRAGVANRLTSTLHADLAPRLAALPGVASVDASLTEMVSLGQVHLLGIPLRGLDPNSHAIKQFSTVQGKVLGANDSGTVLIGSGIEGTLQPRDAGQIEIEETKFRVLGVFPAQNPFDVNSIIAPLADVQKLMGRPGVVSEFQIHVVPGIRDAASLKKLCHEIEQLQDENHERLGLKAQTTSQFTDSATETRLGGAMAWATSAIVLVLSFLAILNTMLMSVMERTPELGVLRAVGWTRPRVMRMIVGESIVMSAAGAIVGLLVACLLGYVLSRLPGTSLIVPRTLSYGALVLGCAAALGAGIVGSLYPAFRAASLNPIDALRYE